MSTGKEDDKDNKLEQIDNLCTIENPDATRARVKAKVKKEKLGGVQIPNDMAMREMEKRKGKRKKNKKKKRKEKPKEKDTEKANAKPKLKDKEQWYMDRRNQILLSLFFSPKLSWEEKVVDVLHVVRCRGFTEYNKKLRCSLPTRFCAYNVAFFDHDKESEDVPWPPIHQVPLPLHAWLDDSVNIIAIKVAKSDVKYPIHIYGTVLARDEYDFRCIYLFRCGRDDPQRITFKDNTLTLISPIRAPAVRDSMFFEFHLKIKGNGDVDEDFSKGCVEHSAIHHTQQPTTKVLCSCLSTMELVYTPVPYALEASVAVSILKGPSDFTSKVTAWTTGNDENKIVLYDSEVAGSRTKLGPGGSVCGLVAVPLYQDLVLRVCVHDEGHERADSFEFVIEQEVDERTLEQGPYKLQAKICWKGVKNQRGYSTWGRPNMWGHIGGRRVLL